MTFIVHLIFFFFLLFRFLFWVEYGNKTQICRTHMDGSAGLFIATTNLGLPTTLAIDLAGKCWLTESFNETTVNLKCYYRGY